MSFETAFKADQDEKIREAEANEEAAKIDVKEARNAIKTGNKERKELLQQKAAENRTLKAAISRRKAATQTRLALQGLDPEPKVKNEKNNS